MWFDFINYHGSTSKLKIPEKNVFLPQFYNLCS